MRVIKVCPVVWFSGAWKTCQECGVDPIFPWPKGREKAIDYARGRFGNDSGEIHVYADDGAMVIETIQVNGLTSMSEEAELFVSQACIPASVPGSLVGAPE